MNDPESSLEAAEKKSLVNASDSYVVLRNRDFRFYMIGRLIATVGQQMLIAALIWELYHRTQSAVALLLAGVTQVVPMILFTLPAGHVADNYDRKKVIVLTTM